MTNARLKGHRGIPVAIYVVGGGAIAAATWVGGSGYGVMCVVGGVAYIFSLLVLKLRG